MQYFDIESIPIMEINNWSKVELVDDGPQILGEVKEAFEREFNRSQKVVVKSINKDHTLTSSCILQITNIIDALINPPTKPYFLAYSVQLLVFQGGWR
ncbi:hypothetical protein OCU04_012562 [Sclerotinia nivalis]|uniref:Uncharacterized protein n=1 Tax=Sclerotinia nivalis TaxID=352851 RepID=A0A9X0A8V1_9HELO|nr:hypothetical protein OCU04_012562 [Sclerotinia nivalis]